MSHSSDVDGASTDADSFDDAVGALLPPYPGVGGIRRPAELLDRYSWLVSRVVSGYDDNIYEYDNDLAVRGFIEMVLREPGMSRFTQFEGFAHRVAEIDGTLEANLTAEPMRRGNGWWETRLPLRGGPEIVEEIEELWGFRPQLVE